ncbi:MAG: hypothetical protein FJW63_09080, partial [Actinobacteria bacterium]|nr:hypothetical protein [Actinomycetota bacterium]
MKSSVFIVVLALFFPMYGRIIPGISGLPYNFVYYSIVLVGIFILWRFLADKKFTFDIKTSILPLLAFCLYYIILLESKGLVSGLIRRTSDKALGVLLGLLIILVIHQSKVISKSEGFFKKLTFYIGILFLGQVCVSVFESISGNPIGNYEIKIYGGIRGRDPLAIFGLDQNAIFGFKLPFTGMIGQHNAFGNMLVFYNIIFLSQFVRNGSKYYLFLLATNIFAVIGNTTRVAIMSVLVSDIIVLIRSLKPKIVRDILSVLLSLFFIYFIIGIQSLAETYFPGSNSLISRFDRWVYLWEKVILPMDLLQLAIGLNSFDIQYIGFDFIGRTMGSYENQFYQLTIFSGFIGLFLFLCAFVFLILIKLKDIE